MPRAKYTVVNKTRLCSPLDLHILVREIHSKPINKYIKSHQVGALKEK